MVFQNSRVWHTVCNHRSRKSRCLQRFSVGLNMTRTRKQTSYAEIIIWRISNCLGVRRWRRWRPETKSMWKYLPLNQKYYVYSSSTLGCLRSAPLQSSFFFYIVIILQILQLLILTSFFCCGLCVTFLFAHSLLVTLTAPINSSIVVFQFN